MSRAALVADGLLVASLAGCAFETASTAPGRTETSRPAPPANPPAMSQRPAATTFYVTTGVVANVSGDQLLAVMAHEVAHGDLGHVAKAQALGTGLNIGAVMLDQLFSGARHVAPTAGALIQSKYSPTEEYAADRHGVELLQRLGRDKEVRINTLAWLQSAEGGVLRKL